MNRSVGEGEEPTNVRCRGAFTRREVHRVNPASASPDVRLQPRASLRVRHLAPKPTSIQ